MPPSRTRLVPRRRRADEGEDEDSITGEVEEDSLSEGSAASLADDDGDAEASDASLDDDGRHTSKPTATTHQISSDTSKPPANKEAQPAVTTFTALADKNVMLNGIHAPAGTDGTTELHFDDAASDNAQVTVDAPQSIEAQLNAPKAPRNETVAQKSRREHQEYIRQRNSNPAFVPNRGGFFLHDDRTSSMPTYVGRAFPRGRGRGFEPGFHGPRDPISETTGKQWAHDLHETHETVQAQQSKLAGSAVNLQTEPTTPATTGPKAPNREFSFSTVLGNVMVYIALPGMPERKAVANVAKKNHTLLPQHRPPLRRDKPVRISIPDDEPRYIFPSTERSFIFIPRALRPNQQSYYRGRGRGSFHGSRRTSVFGGSTYTPSVAMSRKSSYGGIGRDNIRSPTGSTASRPLMMGIEGHKPIVRLPSANIMSAPIPMPQLPAMTPLFPGGALMNGNIAYGVHPAALPMHQPRPQKTVSVADIESPASLSIKGPQQQEEQPFHQQVPTYIGGQQDQQVAGQITGQPNGPDTALMTHIPEGAVYAQSFQPYPFVQPPMMYGHGYPNPPAMYPQMSNSMHFAPIMPPMGVVPSFGGAPMQAQQSNSHATPQIGMMAQESNGMVFYYNPSQFSGSGQQDEYHMMPTPSMMNPQAPYYYPT